MSGEFDWWSPEKLRTLTSALQKGMKNGQLPAESDTEFWSKLPFADDDDELVEDVRSELQSAELQTTPLPGVFLGDLSCAESRLSLLTNSITSIVYIASHQMEPLWAGDGLNYHTITVSPAIEPSKTMLLQLSSATAFIRKHKPTLICSSSPSRLTMVLAAVLLDTAGGGLDVEHALAQCRECGVLIEELAPSDIDDLEAFAHNIVVASDAALSTPRNNKRSLDDGAISPGKSPLPPPALGKTSETERPVRIGLLGVKAQRRVSEEV